MKYGRRSATGIAWRFGSLTWDTDDALVVPESALFRRNDRWATFVVNEGRAQVAYVEVGHRNGELAEVLGGLSEGQTVIAHPSDRVAAGVKVATRDDENAERTP